MPHGGFSEEAATCGGGEDGLILAVVALAITDLRHPRPSLRLTALHWLLRHGLHWAELCGQDPDRLRDIIAEVQQGGRRVHTRNTQGR